MNHISRSLEAVKNDSDSITTSIPKMRDQALLQQLDVKKLAVFRALQVGDMLCAVPALRAFRSCMPDACITLIGLPWAAQFASRFKRYIDDFIPFPGHAAFPEQPVQERLIPAFYEAVCSRRFDLAIQMHGSGQISNQIVNAFGAKTVAGYTVDDRRIFDKRRFLDYPETGPEPIRLLKLAEFLGAPSLGTHLEFPLTTEDEQELAESDIANGLAPGSYICVHPGARIRDKCWSPQKFAQVADRIAEDFGLSVVLTGSAKEVDLTTEVARHMRTEAINAAAPISIGAMAALMCRARLLVCNDTGVSHIAAGLKLPSVVVFSKSDPERWAPLNQKLHRCIWDPEGERMDQVLESARELLAGSSFVAEH